MFYCVCYTDKLLCLMTIYTDHLYSSCVWYKSYGGPEKGRNMKPTTALCNNNNYYYNNMAKLHVSVYCWSHCYNYHRFRAASCPAQSVQSSYWLQRHSKLLRNVCNYLPTNMASRHVPQYVNRHIHCCEHIEAHTIKVFDLGGRIWETSNSLAT